MFDLFKKKSVSSSTLRKTANSNVTKNGSAAQSNIQTECIAYKNSGDAYLNQGDFEKASICYRQAIAYNPNYAEAYNNLGNASNELHLFNDAERYMKQAIAIKPELANVYYNLATLLVDQDRLIEAIENYANTLRYDQKFYAAQALLLFQYQKICKWVDYISHIKILRDAVFVPPESSVSIFSPFTFLAVPGATAEEQKLCAERWIKSEFDVSENLRNKFEFKVNRTSNTKISIAYISADFQQHPVSFLIAEVIELHDRSRFNVTAYSYGPDDSSTMRLRLAEAFDNFVDIQHISNEDAAKKIYADHIDILVDLTGHTRNSRSAILAKCPAPIQVNYLGYPGTMGADFIDYLIADSFTIPTEMKKHYTENVVWMPDCFQANDRTRHRPVAPSRKQSGLPERYFVFCCFNQTFKITPEVFDIWCRLLKTVPDSVLWLPASNNLAEANLRLEMQRRGIAKERLVMAPLLPTNDHLARLQCADLFLDTLPYNAGTTCSDALWMGLPVVTCAGEAFVSRMAGSLLTAIGVPELITYSLEDYYQLAFELATDRDKLDSIRNKIIANRDTSPLFDSERFTRNLEKLYMQMMDDYSKQPIPLS